VREKRPEKETSKRSSREQVGLGRRPAARGGRATAKSRSQSQGTGLSRGRRDLNGTWGESRGQEKGGKNHTQDPRSGFSHPLSKEPPRRSLNLGQPAHHWAEKINCNRKGTPEPGSVINLRGASQMVEESQTRRRGKRQKSITPLEVQTTNCLSGGGYPVRWKEKKQGPNPGYEERGDTGGEIVKQELQGGNKPTM